MYNKKEGFLALLAITALLLSFLTVSTNSATEPLVSARAAALYEPESERFLFMKNGNERLGMASTTKIMTALIALERLEPDTQVHIDSRAIGTDGSSVYLKEGEVMSAEGLIYALMLRSANDAAEALAYEIAGDIDGFCALMNERAASLGLTDTCFKNPHGLDAKGHYTTAHDLAIITAEAMKNEDFVRISSTYKTTVESNMEERLIVNHNKLLRLYDGAIGVKTGYTQITGRSLVGAAERDGLRLISVTLDAPDDWTDHRKMLDFGFSTTHKVRLICDGEYTYSLPVVNGESSEVKIKSVGDVNLIYGVEKPEIKREIYLDRLAVAPVSSGDVLGRIVFYNGEEIIAEVSLVATEDVARAKKPSIFDIFT